MNAALYRASLLSLLGALLLHLLPAPPQADRPEMKFKWPDGKQAALSLTWDDARSTQTVKGTPLLDRYGIKATFFVVPSAVKRELEGWKRAVAAGHEIANHSVNHPCSANFPWARKFALENYTLERMRDELRDANRQIKDLLGVDMRTFAYPCGQTFVGRGVETRSYVPVIAEEFLAGRNWMAESPNDPLYCDMAQLTGIEMDGKDFKQILPILEEAKKNASWLVLGGHEMDKSGRQTTRLAMLQRLLEHVKKPESGIWVDTVSTIARYVVELRKSLSTR